MEPAAPLNSSWLLSCSREARASLVSTLILAVLVGGVYPLATWALAQVFFSSQANGSLFIRQGRVVGSTVISQRFVDPRYFHPRPSAAGDGYDAARSGGSNLGPLSRSLIEEVDRRIAAYRQENGLSADSPVPADAVTASGSGLDPHISVRNAFLQARRVARSRGINEEELLAKIRARTEGRDLGVLGEPRVNVLQLNLDLDGNP